MKTAIILINFLYAAVWFAAGIYTLLWRGEVVAGLLMLILSDIQFIELELRLQP